MSFGFGVFRFKTHIDQFAIKLEGLLISWNSVFIENTAVNFIDFDFFSLTKEIPIKVVLGSDSTDPFWKILKYDRLHFCKIGFIIYKVQTGSIHDDYA